MSQRNSEYERVADENYETPEWLAATVASYLRAQGARQLWEPAVPKRGRSQLAEALRAQGFWVAETRQDFLRFRAGAITGVDAIVTNPPYGRAAPAFVRHALALDVPIVAMLLRVDFDSGKTRRDLFADCPYFAGKIVLLDRIVWFDQPGAKPSENHAWFLWNKVVDRPALKLIRYAQRT